MKKATIKQYEVIVEEAKKAAEESDRRAEEIREIPKQHTKK